MKKSLIAMGLLLALGAAQAAELFNNGPVVNADGLSFIRLTGYLAASGAQSPARVGDDFTVSGAGWNVNGLSFFLYQDFSFGQFTFSNVTWNIIAGDVNGGSVVASGSAVPTNGGLLGYRTTSNTPGDTMRPIMQLDVDVPAITLAPGTYWLTWNAIGSQTTTWSAVPWQPPTSDGAVGNGVRSLDGASFFGVVDPGDNLGVEFPFVIQGSLVPEPSAWALMLAGGLIVGGVARRRRTS